MKSLKLLSASELISLRSKIDHALEKRQIKEHRELARLVDTARSLTRRASRPGRGGTLKGRKLKPKFRNPAKRTETWAGRGHQPRWLRAELKRGQKLKTFLIK